LDYAPQDKMTDKYYLGHVQSEAPRRHVKITKPFYLGMYQVTQGEYEKVMGINPSSYTGKQVDASTFKPALPENEVRYRTGNRNRTAGMDTSRHPVETVNWDDAMEFCRRLSAIPAERAAGRVYRLPTEAEWEYACRAGTTTRWYYGDDEAGLQEYAWFSMNSGKMTHPVGGKRPNRWGLFDMHGNVYQWCADWYSTDYYAHSPPSDPTGPTVGFLRAQRGGFWNGNASFCRSAYRNTYGLTFRGLSTGFRVVAGR
jgi:formylglycine-generating enzyme required for sulfatase activity